MKRLSLLLLLALGCGDDALPPEDCDVPLPARDDDGNPWPSYAEANASLCERAPTFIPRRGTCADGKRFVEFGGGYIGEIQYFTDEVLVGVLRYPDTVLACPEYYFGDTRCESAVTEDVACP